VQAAPHGAAGVVSSQRSDGRAGYDSRTATHQHSHGFVLSADPVRMVDHDDTAPGDRPGEADDARPCREDRLSGGHGEIHAEVPGPVGRSRRVEAPHHA
jgi:hypothetical protein